VPTVTAGPLEVIKGIVEDQALNVFGIWDDKFRVGKLTSAGIKISVAYWLRTKSLLQVLRTMIHEGTLGIYMY
jgi:hypothetical protein